MRAMAISRFGGPEELRETDLPDPAPGPGQVLVRVAAAGVNPVDHKMRDGSSKFVQSLTEADFPFVLGREMSGRVAAVGEGVEGFEPGQSVFGIADAGCYGEQAVVPAANLALLPDGVDLTVAGGLALAGLTAMIAVRDLGRVTADDVVLVHGAGGGVGQIAVQLARATGAEVWASASPRHHDKLRRWGAHPVDYATQDVTALPTTPTVIIDGVYFGTYEPSIATLSPGDRLVVLPTLADLTPAREKGLQVGVPQLAPDAGRLAELARMVADGTLEVEVGATFPLARAADAQRLVEGGHAPGKVVLTLTEA